MDELLVKMFEPFHYSFMIKAMLVGALIGVCCSCLGIFLVLKRYAMISDGLAHVSFTTVAIALFVQASPLLVSVPIVMVASIFIMKLNEKAQLYGDSAIGLVSSLAMATGVLLVSVSQGFNVDIYSFLFGSILMISPVDVWLSIILATTVLAVIGFFFNSLFAVTYDEEFAKSAGLKTGYLHYVIVLLTAVTIVLGTRVVGTMLISSLIIFPTVSALQIQKGFKATMLISASISVICTLLGIYLSFILDIPSGAAIVILNAIIFAIFLSRRFLR